MGSEDCHLTRACRGSQRLWRGLGDLTLKPLALDWEPFKRCGLFYEAVFPKAFFLGRGGYSCGVLMCEPSAKKLNFVKLPLVMRVRSFSAWDGFLRQVETDRTRAPEELSPDIQHTLLPKLCILS